MRSFDHRGRQVQIEGTAVSGDGNGGLTVYLGFFEGLSAPAKDQRRHPVMVPRSAYISTMHRLRLAELHDMRFDVIADQALKDAPVMTFLLGWRDERKAVAIRPDRPLRLCTLI
jgi:hypothetical protein